MTDQINRFYNSIREPQTYSQWEIIDFFIYFLTVELGNPSCTAKKIDQCFVSLDLQKPTRTAAYLSDSAKGRNPKLIKADIGYKLQRHFRENISKQLGVEKIVLQTSIELRSLEANFPEGKGKDFLSETIDCYEAGAERATIVMCWILTLNHLFDYVLKHRLIDFNTALAKNTDKRIKISQVKCRDDFTEMPEGKFIEFCRTGKIITNDIRKILDQKLETRNSSAHPSGVSIKKSKVIDFVEDLVQNVILNYSL